MAKVLLNADIERLKDIMFTMMYPEPGGPEWPTLKRQVRFLATITGTEEMYEEWLEQPLPF